MSPQDRSPAYELLGHAQSLLSMNMTKPLFSVVIDTYNHESFIEKAVSSVLAQTFPASEREIIVVDDGSTDRTVQMLQPFESQLRIIRKQNGGQASAFNAAIPGCRGEFIAFLDGDDWWAPNKLQVIADTVAQDRSVGMIGHAFEMVSDDAPSQIISLGQKLHISLKDAASANIFRLQRCYFGTSRLILRADVARKCLPVPESLVFEADEYLFTVAAALTGGVILPDALTCYRLHSSNLFIKSGSSVEGERRKQNVLASLAAELQRILPTLGLPSASIETVVQIVELEAAQLRLKLDGGWSWETVSTESQIYRIQHPQASWRSSAFRMLSMLPALILPPRSFYALRRWLSSRSFYHRARQNLIPIPQISLPKSSSSTTDPANLSRS
jgi:hypothetical protein